MVQGREEADVCDTRDRYKSLADTDIAEAGNCCFTLLTDRLGSLEAIRLESMLAIGQKGLPSGLIVSWPQTLV